VVTVASVSGLISETIFGGNLGFLFLIRTLRLLRLFEYKKRYRDIVGTFIFIVAKRFGSVSIVILIVYYFFGILGMEMFAKYDMRNCCINSSVEQDFRYENINGTINGGLYYLNNFSNIVNSYITLFELMVVNNWFILMEGYSYVTTGWSRVYFMTFYICTNIIITIVVAFVIEAFLFRINYRRKMGDMIDTVTLEQTLSEPEMTFCESPQAFDLAKLAKILKHYPNTSVSTESSWTGGQAIPMPSMGNGSRSTMVYRGVGKRNKFAFCLRMYADQVVDWIAEFDGTR